MNAITDLVSLLDESANPHRRAYVLCFDTNLSFYAFPHDVMLYPIRYSELVDECFCTSTHFLFKGPFGKTFVALSAAF